MSNKIWKKSLTVQLIFLVIISRSFCSTFDSFYLPALIVVFDHMCLLLGPIFCITETGATHKKEEEEKMCERLFHLNNCWLCQTCPVSYSVLTAFLLNHAFEIDVKLNCFVLVRSFKIPDISKVEKLFVGILIYSHCSSCWCLQRQ